MRRVDGEKRMEWAMMPLRRYAEFDGRSTRREYWGFQLFYTLIMTALVIAFAIAVAMTPQQDVGGVAVLFLIAMIVTGVGFIVPQVSVTVRRFHDQDRSGLFALLAFIPYVGGVILIVFMFLGGTSGPNRFGDDPREVRVADVFA
jgi:uncharacterized membrane protein YhaH (DUF805 family)